MINFISNIIYSINPLNKENLELDSHTNSSERSDRLLHSTERTHDGKKTTSLIKLLAGVFFLGLLAGADAARYQEPLLQSPFYQKEITELTTFPFSTLKQSPFIQCPLKKSICDPNNRSSSFNFVCKPGFHSSKSPVTGSRAHELKAIKGMMKSEPILVKFESAMRNTPLLDCVITKQYEYEAENISKQILSDYLDKYRHCGVDESNVIRWIDNPKGMGGSGGGYVSTIRARDFNPPDDWHLAAVALSINDKAAEKLGVFLPRALVAYHEIMHVEETPKEYFLCNLDDLSFLPFRDDGDCDSRNGVELIPTLQSYLLNDEVYKKSKGIDLTTEVDYQRNIIVAGHSIEFGKLTNFYRDLQAKYGTLAGAIISEESIDFIKGK
jgi:hypothetical protein